MLCSTQLIGFASGSAPSSMIYVDDTMSASNNISIPAGATIGDLAILGTVHTTGTFSSFMTEITDANAGSYAGKILVKVLDQDDLTRGNFNSTGSNKFQSLSIVRPTSGTFYNSAASTIFWGSTINPYVGSAQLMAILFFSHIALVSPTITPDPSTTNPAFYNNTSLVSKLQMHLVGYNGTGTSLSASMGDGGDDILMSARIVMNEL